MEINKTGSGAAIISPSDMNNIRNKTKDEGFEEKLQAAIDNKDSAQLKKVCREFEGIFLNMMYKQMRSSVKEAELIPQQSGREIFQSMLDEKLMDTAAEGRGTGFAEMLYKQLSRELDKD